MGSYVGVLIGFEFVVVIGYCNFCDEFEDLVFSGYVY